MTSPPPTRLYPPVDARADRVLGDENAQITLVEYGSFSCPYCYAAHDILANLRDRFGSRLRYVFRHRPITGNEHALAAAELAEYAGATTGEFWAIHDALMQRGPALRTTDLPAIAAEFGVPAPEGEHAEAMRRARETVQRHRESASRSGALEAYQGETRIFIYPGFEFRIVDALLTNFHLPESTLLMLVSAFSSRENILNAYKSAVSEKYRFFSYGDAMFIS